MKNHNRTQFLKQLALLFFGAVFVSVLYAQLDIPTNINNAVQTIQTIVVTDNGRSDGNKVMILNSGGTASALQVSGSVVAGNSIGSNETLLNKIVGTFSSILAGARNKIFGGNSTIVGGNGNILTGGNSTILGGENNMVNGDYSTAGGKNAQANHSNTWVWSDYDPSYGSSFASTNSNQFLIRVLNGVGINTNNPGATLDVNGSFKQGASYRSVIQLPMPGANVGAGRWYIRLHPSSSVNLASVKVTVQGSWNYSPIMGWLTAEYSYYSPGNGTINTNDFRVTSTEGTAYTNLRIGDLVVENGYVSIPVWSSNTNAPVVIVEYSDFGIIKDTLTNTSWASSALPAQNFQSIQGNLHVDGNLGVGINAPATRLDVNGTTRYRGDSQMDAGYSSYFGKEESFGGTDVGGADYGFIRWDNDNNTYNYWGDSSENGALVIGSMNDGNNSVGDSVVLKPSASTIVDSQMIVNGNVGIGTTSPATKLDVVGSATFGTNTSSRGAYSNGLSLQNTAGAATSLFLWENGVGSAHVGFKANDNNLYIVNATTDGSIANSSSITLTTDGKVGIGTTTPGSKLHVKGLQNNTINSTTAVAKILANDVGVHMGGLAGTPNYGAWLQSMRESDSLAFPLLLQPNGGDVGIGTNSPRAKLDVYGSVNGGRTDNLVLSNAGANNNSATSLYMGYQEAGLGFYGARILQVSSPALTRSSDLLFQIHGGPADNADSSWNTPMMIQRDTGNVGIGTTTPTEKLDVNGNIIVRPVDSNGGIKFTGTNATRLYSDANTAGLWLFNSTTSNLFLGTNYDWDLQAKIAYTPGTAGAGNGVLSIGQTQKNNANYTHGVTSLYTNGQERLKIDKNGNVGIGTSGPIEKLEVAGNIKSPGLWTKGVGVFASGTNATAMGTNTKAAGSNSTAMGNNTYAKGSNSTAMGYGNGISTDYGALGEYSTAIGGYARAKGRGSTSIGWDNLAQGQSSVAMGQSTNAIGDYSIAMGIGTNAGGYMSTAMGVSTNANGYSSTAMGNLTNAVGQYSTAMGYYNVGYSDSLLEVGAGGYSQNNGGDIQANALTIYNNGALNIETHAGNGYQYSINNNYGAGFTVSDCGGYFCGYDNNGSYLQISPSNTDRSNYMYADYMYSSDFGDLYFDYNVANMWRYGIYTNPSNYGDAWYLDGQVYADSYDGGSTFQGYYYTNYLVNNGPTTYTDTSIANSAISVSPTANVAMGSDISHSTSTTDDKLTVYGTLKTSGLWAKGANVNANGTYATAMGYNTTASDYATAMGYSTTAAFMSTAMGRETHADGSHSTAMGYQTYAKGAYSTAMGYGQGVNTNYGAIGDYSTAIGYNSLALGAWSTAMGMGVKANAHYSTAIGINTTTTAGANYSTVMGNGTTTKGYNSTAMGLLTTASGATSTAMGNNTIANGDNSTAMGKFNVGINGAALEVGNGTSTSARSNSLTILNNSNVGIGTTGPTNKLTIQGDHGGTQVLLHSLGANVGDPSTEADMMLWASEPGATYQGVGISNNVKNFNVPGVTTFPRISTSRGGSYMRLLDNSINLSTVDSAGSYATPLVVGASTVTVNGRLNASEISTPTLIVDKLVNRTVANITVSGQLLPDTSAPAASQTIGSTSKPWKELYAGGINAIANGNVGIGISPTQKFEVNGNAKINGFINTSIPEQYPSDFDYNDPSHIMVQWNSDGWIRKIPSSELRVGYSNNANYADTASYSYNADQAYQAYQSYYADNANIANTANSMYDSNYAGGWYMQDTTWIRSHNSKSVWLGAGLLGSDGGLTVGYGGAGSPVGGAIIKGNVGIGTNSPSASAKLNVVGNIYADADWTNDTALRIREGASDTYGAFFKYGLGDALSIGTRNGSATDVPAIQIARGSSDVQFNGTISTTASEQYPWDIGDPSYIMAQFGSNVIQKINPQYLTVGNANRSQYSSNADYASYANNADYASYAYNISNQYNGAPVTFALQGSEKMRISTDGNVGIGVTNPSNKLEVVGSGVTTFEGAGIYNTYSYGNANKAESRLNLGKIEGGSTRQAMGSIGGFPTSNTSSADGVLAFYTRKTQVMNERMRINQDGNVGIGTTSPSEKFEVNGNVKAANFITSVPESYPWDYGDPTYIMAQFGNNVIQKINPQYLIVGTANYAYQSDYAYNADSAYYSSYSNIADYAYNINNQYNGSPVTFALDGTERMRVSTNGNVGIGTTSPGAKLQVTANSTYSSENGPLMVTDGTTPAKKVSIGFDTSLDAGYISALHSGIAWKNLILQGGGGNVGIGTSASERLDVSGNIKSSAKMMAPQYCDIFGTNCFTAGNVAAPFASLVANYIPRWNGSALVNSSISDDGSTVKITASLQINGGATITGFSTDKTLGGASPSDSVVPTQAAVQRAIQNCPPFYVSISDDTPGNDESASYGTCSPLTWRYPGTPSNYDNGTALGLLAAWDGGGKNRFYAGDAGGNDFNGRWSQTARAVCQAFGFVDGIVYTHNASNGTNLRVMNIPSTMQFNTPGNGTIMQDVICFRANSVSGGPGW